MTLLTRRFNLGFSHYQASPQHGPNADDHQDMRQVSVVEIVVNDHRVIEYKDHHQQKDSIPQHDPAASIACAEVNVEVEEEHHDKKAIRQVVLHIFEVQRDRCENEHENELYYVDHQEDSSNDRFDDPVRMEHGRTLDRCNGKHARIESY